MKNENLIIYIMMLGTFGVLSTEMGVVGIPPQIAEYFSVDITQAGLFASLFTLTIIGAVVVGMGVQYVMIAAIVVMVIDLILLFNRSNRYHIEA